MKCSAQSLGPPGNGADGNKRRPGLSIGHLDPTGPGTQSKFATSGVSPVTWDGLTDGESGFMVRTRNVLAVPWVRSAQQSESNWLAVVDGEACLQESLLSDDGYTGYTTTTRVISRGLTIWYAELT